MNVAWLRQSLNFYNRLLERPNDDVVRQACMDDIRLGGEAGCKTSWSYHIRACMRRIGCLADEQAMLAGHQINVLNVMTAFCDA
jgi:hypothetical protein